MYLSLSWDRSTGSTYISDISLSLPLNRSTGRTYVYSIYLCVSLFLSPTEQEYGKVPGYLERRKQEIAEAQADYDRYVEESLHKGQMEQVSQEERWAGSLSLSFLSFPPSLPHFLPLSLFLSLFLSPFLSGNLSGDGTAALLIIKAHHKLPPPDSVLYNTCIHVYIDSDQN